jgi:hypothetical protein
MVKNVYLIESAKDLLKLLDTNLNKYNEEELSNLYNRWIHSVIELYNNKAELILLGNIETKNSEQNIFKKSYKENYEFMKSSLNDIVIKDNANEEDIFISVYGEYNNNIIDETKKKYNLSRLIVFLFQYLHTFEDKSINENLWNYSLRSVSVSCKSTVIGLFTLICQYLMTIALIYSIIDDYEASKDTVVILITIISTIISFLYSYDTLHSFVNSIPLYRFLLTIYSDFPEITLQKEERDLVFYKNRNINMKKSIIKYNFVCDFLSNFILPLIIPFINIFIILNSESIIDAILNSVAIFFIIQIDEELYSRTDYESDQMSINFTRWILSNIFCHYFDDYRPYFVKETNEWHRSSIRLSNRFKNKVRPITSNE